MKRHSPEGKEREKGGSANAYFFESINGLTKREDTECYQWQIGCRQSSRLLLLKTTMTSDTRKILSSHPSYALPSRRTCSDLEEKQKGKKGTFHRRSQAKSQRARLGNVDQKGKTKGSKWGNKWRDIGTREKREPTISERKSTWAPN